MIFLPRRDKRVVFQRALFNFFGRVKTGLSYMFCFRVIMLISMSCLSMYLCNNYFNIYFEVNMT